MTNKHKEALAKIATLEKQIEQLDSKLDSLQRQLCKATQDKTKNKAGWLHKAKLWVRRQAIIIGLAGVLSGVGVVYDGLHGASEVYHTVQFTVEIAHSAADYAAEHITLVKLIKDDLAS